MFYQKCDLFKLAYESISKLFERNLDKAWLIT